MIRPRFTMPLVALGAGALLAAGAPGLAAVSEHSVPHPKPPREAFSLVVAGTGALADTGHRATVHVDVTCPTGYRGAVLMEVVGRSATRGKAHTVGFATVTCTGAAQGVDVTTGMPHRETHALAAGSARVVARLVTGPADRHHGRGPGRNVTVVRSVSLG